ncbi:MAG: cadherin-like domain-containing protein [Candidatus Thiodiazotropha sp. (ex Ustalcina ferruginea)]|nr:cadherin-like domain-containing protein [Candidatus Thiodiazotropha sp. (ex Ustalcina ferruginea)]
MEVLKSGNFLYYDLIAMLLTSCMDKNSAPEASDDSARLYQGESIAIEVLKNDHDDENDPLQVRILTAPSHGSVSLQSDGLVIYHHDGSSSTQDSFIYTLYDGATDSAPANVNLSITLTRDGDPYNAVTTDTSPSNTAPVANSDIGTVFKGGRVSLSLLHNDRDAENDALSILTLTNPVNGSVSQHTDGTVIYQHDGSNTTDDHFSYTISDGMTSSEPANVGINIASYNRPPEFTHSGIDVELHVNELYSLVVNASDPDGDRLTFSAANLPYWLVFSSSTHTLSGVPSWAELDKSYTLTLSVSDGMKTVENNLTLTVVGHQAVTDAMAHRLLLQTTYGPTLSDIQQVKQLGIVQWIDNQFTMGSAYNNSGDGWKTHLERTQEIAVHAEPDHQLAGQWYIQ